MKAIQSILVPNTIALVSILANAAAVPSTTSDAPPAPSVTLDSGVVVGTTAPYPAATDIISNKFIGIPYAQSPPLRFGLPQPAPGWWSTPLDATRRRAACMQQWASEQIEPVRDESEDCLYVNVFTPAGAEPSGCDSGGKAVLVWIYGGNLQSGGADIKAFDGSVLAASQDVVVVTFNHRMNVFGFSNAPEIPLEERNVGFHDQRFALDWVRSNIRSFGGDPEKITVFGESSGGHSVERLLALPPGQLPFRAAIIQSEGLNIPGDWSENWATLAQSLGCADQSSTLECLRAKDANEIKAAIEKESLGFPPVEDNVTYVANTTSSFATGQAAKVPVMMGSNGQEMSPLADELGFQDRSELVKFLSQFAPKDMVDLLLEKFSPRASAFDIATRLFTDLVHTCPTASLAALAQDSGNPVWRYYFNASFPNSEMFPGSGAYHWSEIPQVFGTYTRENATDQQRELSDYMQTAWASFAKDPTGGPGWQEFGKGRTGDLGSDGRSEVKTIASSEIDGLCEILAGLSVDKADVVVPGSS